VLLLAGLGQWQKRLLMTRHAASSPKLTQFKPWDYVASAVFLGKLIGSSAVLRIWLLR